MNTENTISPPTHGLCASVPSAPSCSNAEAELRAPDVPDRIKALIAEAQHNLNYAHASNCPLFFVNLAQQKLTEALQ